MSFDPILLLAMWAAGLAGCAALAAWWRVARTGYVWLSGGVVILVGLAAAFADGRALAAVAMAGAGMALARRPRVAAVSFLLSAAGFLAAAATRDAWLPALIGAAALGGVTAEMLLGHWYLVDPKLPRWALRRLDAIGIAGVAGEVTLAAVRGTLRPPTGLFGAAYLMLATTTLLLAVGVWFSLREKGYEGVMAATGLSYLATLTVLGTAFLGRAPVERLLGGG